MFDFILIEISVTDFSLKIRPKSTETRSWNHSMFTFRKTETLFTDFLRYVIWVVKRNRKVLGTKQKSKYLTLNLSK